MFRPGHDGAGLFTLLPSPLQIGSAGQHCYSTRRSRSMKRPTAPVFLGAQHDDHGDNASRIEHVRHACLASAATSGVIDPASSSVTAPPLVRIGAVVLNANPSAAQEPKVCRLSAGASRIRTRGPTLRRAPLPKMRHSDSEPLGRRERHHFGRGTKS